MAGAGREKRVETCTLFNWHYHDKTVKMQQVFVKKKVLKILLKTSKRRPVFNMSTHKMKMYLWIIYWKNRNYTWFEIAIMLLSLPIQNSSFYIWPNICRYSLVLKASSGCQIPKHCSVFKEYFSLKSKTHTNVFLLFLLKIETKAWSWLFDIWF